MTTIETKGAAARPTLANRRMFGMLQGTLSSFKQDYESSSKALESREKVIQKVVEKIKSQDYDDLYVYKNDYDACVRGFIATNALPRIYYLPRKIDDASRALVVENDARQTDETAMQTITDDECAVVVDTNAAADVHMKVDDAPNS